MRIELVIDELRLHGFDARRRHAVADAVEREAAALVASQLHRLTGQVSGTREQVDGGRFDLTPDAERVGRAIARAMITAVLEPNGAPGVVQAIAPVRAANPNQEPPR